MKSIVSSLFTASVFLLYFAQFCKETQKRLPLGLIGEWGIILHITTRKNICCLWLKFDFGSVRQAVGLSSPRVRGGGMCVPPPLPGGCEGEGQPARGAGSPPSSCFVCVQLEKNAARHQNERGQEHDPDVREPCSVKVPSVGRFCLFWSLPFCPAVVWKCCGTLTCPLRSWCLATQRSFHLTRSSHRD